MNTCQLAQPQQAITFNLLPFYSSNLSEVKYSRSRSAVSVLHSPTLTIRAVAAEKLEQIANHPLTSEERLVLKMIVEGNSNLAIAQELHVRIETVKTQVRSILSKLNVKDRAQAAVVALRSGLVD